MSRGLGIRPSLWKTLSVSTVLKITYQLFYKFYALGYIHKLIGSVVKQNRTVSYRWTKTRESDCYDDDIVI